MRCKPPLERSDQVGDQVSGQLRGAEAGGHPVPVGQIHLLQGKTVDHAVDPSKLGSHPTQDVDQSVIGPRTATFKAHMGERAGRVTAFKCCLSSEDSITGASESIKVINSDS